MNIFTLEFSNSFRNPEYPKVNLTHEWKHMSFSNNSIDISDSVLHYVVTTLSPIILNKWIYGFFLKWYNTLERYLKVSWLLKLINKSLIELLRKLLCN